MPPETIIRSRHNPIYKQIRSLLRRDRRHEERAFLVEGPRFIADAQRFGAKPQMLVLSETFASSLDLPENAFHVARILDDELFSTVSDTVASQGMLGVFAFPDLTPDPAVELLSCHRRWHPGSGKPGNVDSVRRGRGRDSGHHSSGNSRSLVAQNGARRRGRAFHHSSRGYAVRRACELAPEGHVGRGRRCRRIRPIRRGRHVGTSGAHGGR